MDTANEITKKRKLHPESPPSDIHSPTPARDLTQPVAGPLSSPGGVGTPGPDNLPGSGEDGVRIVPCQRCFSRLVSHPGNVCRNIADHRLIQINDPASANLCRDSRVYNCLSCNEVDDEPCLQASCPICHEVCLAFTDLLLSQVSSEGGARFAAAELVRAVMAYNAAEPEGLCGIAIEENAGKGPASDMGSAGVQDTSLERGQKLKGVLDSLATSMGTAIMVQKSLAPSRGGSKEEFSRYTTDLMNILATSHDKVWLLDTEETTEMSDKDEGAKDDVEAEITAPAPKTFNDEYDTDEA
ncbi:hypothetical protein PG988_003828 [Apiospora saccharicola]